MFRRFLIQAVLLVGFVLVLGTIGYRSVEPGWSLLDALYMTVITITTVGFGEIHDLSANGRAFTIIMIFVGVAAVGILGSRVASLVIDRQMEDLMGRGKVNKAIRNLKDHYLICGFGRIGSTICSILKSQGTPLVVLELDDALVEQAYREGHYVIKGNATQDSVLKDGGVERAAGVVAALADDADNSFIALAARDLNPSVFIISRSEEAGVEGRIKRAGANLVVSPLKLGGEQIATVIREREARPATPEPQLSPY